MSFIKYINRPPRKYPHARLVGEPIKSLDELMKAIERRNYFFIAGRKGPTHWGWAGSLPASTVARLIKSGGICIAHRNPDVPYVFTIHERPDMQLELARACGYDGGKFWATCDELPHAVEARSLAGCMRSCKAKLLDFRYDVPHETIKIEYRIIHECQ